MHEAYNMFQLLYKHWYKNEWDVVSGKTDMYTVNWDKMWSVERFL